MIDLTVPADDELPLAATLWNDDLNACVVVAPGVGIRRHFYRHFAGFLADEGFSVITYDHRGIGDSLQGSIRRAGGSMTTWSKLDTNGIVRWARERSGGPIFLLGHSGGGQMLGMLESARELAGAIFVSAQSGYWGHWPIPHRLVMAVLWFVIVPGLTSTLGYFPARTFRLGENLPAGVAREWSRWGRSPGYLFDHVSEDDLERYESLDRPILAWSFRDDLYAPLAATRALLSRYPSANIDHRRVSPRDQGRDHIGHFGFFRPESRETLWLETVNWLYHQSESRSDTDDHENSSTRPS